MNHNIGVGLMVGLAFATTMFFLNSGHFTKTQKLLLGILILFPPGQWLFALIFWGVNSAKSSLPVYEQSTINKDLENLITLKNQGILSDEEFKTKSLNLESQSVNLYIKGTPEYKSLESLKKSGLISEIEFETKLKEIRKKYSDSFQTEKDYGEQQESFHKNSKGKVISKKLPDGRILRIYSSLSVGYTKGDKVTINGKYPDDGVYKFSWADSLTVKDGIIIKL